MAPGEDVSFELERFEWTADDRLEVVGRWRGVSGRRIFRPALTVEAGGRRHRVSGSAETDSDDAWRATFAWDGARGEIASAELELGRSLVVELPPPRRRRRRRGSTTESDLRAQVDELRVEREALSEELSALRTSRQDASRLNAELETLRAAAPGEDELAAARAEAEAARAEAEKLAAELVALREEQPDLEALRAEAESTRAEADRLAGAPSEADELAGLRLAHGSLKAAHEQLEDELERLRGVREERDELAGQLEQLKAQHAEQEQERASLGEFVGALQERATAAEGERDRLTQELADEREEVARLERLLAEREIALRDAQSDAERRVATERATTTEVHARLAGAREEAQRSMVAEAEETERLRSELERSREDAERLLATERAEVARLREELVTRHDPGDTAGDEASRRMLERVTRDLDRERATTRTLRRELEALRAESAGQRRGPFAPAPNGTTTSDDTLPAATPVGRSVRTPLGTQRRIEAARAGASQRVPRVPPARWSLWVVRLFAALAVAAVGIALVIVVQAATH